MRVLAIANLRMESLSPWHPSPWPWTRSWPTDFSGVQFGEASSQGALEALALVVAVLLARQAGIQLY